MWTGHLRRQTHLELAQGRLQQEPTARHVHGDYGSNWWASREPDLKWLDVCIFNQAFGNEALLDVVRNQVKATL